jgi:hypothetical protein
VVSAASGAVGQLVGQIAKLAGCRAGCREIGFDAGINYKEATDLTAAVKESCPQGVDVFFDNTGGPMHDAVMRNLSIGARVVICGRTALPVSSANLTSASGSWGQLIVSRASVPGFLVLDWWHRRLPVGVLNHKAHGGSRPGFWTDGAVHGGARLAPPLPPAPAQRTIASSDVRNWRTSFSIRVIKVEGAEER